MMPVKDRTYRPLAGAQGAYVLFYDDEREVWGWLWEESGEVVEFGPYSKTRADALRSIADDWEQAVGEPLPRFVGMLRGLAKRAEKAEATA